MSQAKREKKFAVQVLRGIGAQPNRGNVSALVGWMRAEGGHWHNDARYNPLNTTLDMPGSGDTGTQGNISQYRNWRQGVKATVKTLKNGHYEGIIKSLRNGSKADVARAIDASPWGTHGSLVSQTILGTDIDGPIPQATGGRPLPRRSTVDPGRPPRLVGDPGGLDAKSAWVDALLDPRKNMSLLDRFQENVNSGAYELPNTLRVKDGRSPSVIQGARPPRRQGDQSRQSGTVHVADGANRAGVGLSKTLTNAVEHFAGVYGAPVTITTGTNHSQMTTSGNVSDHWDGHGADLAASGATLTKMGRRALRAFGMPKEQARKAQGGLYNLTWRGKRVQVIFNTTVGGNHWNHLHIGVR